MCLLSAILLISCNKTEPSKDPHAGGQMPPGMGGQQMPPGMGGAQPGAGMAEEGSKSTVKVNGNILELENVQLTTPASWVNEKPTSSMRAVQYFLKDDEETTIVGSYFGKRDEMVDANIQRWKDQFSKTEKTDKVELSGGQVIMVSLTGTYMKKASMMSEEFTEAPNYMMLAAIVKTNNGPYFFKMVGPKSTLSNELASFKKFLASYKVK